jgi:hypothetical protein
MARRRSAGRARTARNTDRNSGRSRSQPPLVSLNRLITTANCQLSHSPPSGEYFLCLNGQMRPIRLCRCGGVGEPLALLNLSGFGDETQKPFAVQQRRADRRFGWLVRATIAAARRRPRRARRRRRLQQQRRPRRPGRPRRPRSRRPRSRRPRPIEQRRCRNRRHWP